MMMLMSVKLWIVVILWSPEVITFGSAKSPLPDQLNSFLEVLFDQNECEDFLTSGQWSAVATRDCAPKVCDFPRRICMRPSQKFQDEKSNTCVKIPDDCLTAANGGKPLVTIPEPVIEGPDDLFSEFENKVTSSPVTLAPFGVVNRSTPKKINLCESDVADGRFCGFKIMYAYNRENRRCEQFWFPGCTTKETNSNLFATEEECNEATSHCAEYWQSLITTNAVINPKTQTSAVVPEGRTSSPKLLPSTLLTKTPVKPIVAPTVGPIKPPAPVIRPAVPGGSGPGPAGSLIPTNAQTIIGLITNSISSFTGNGLGGEQTGAGVNGGGGFLGQIPQFFRNFQIG